MRLSSSRAHYEAALNVTSLNSPRVPLPMFALQHITDLVRHRAESEKCQSTKIAAR